MARAARKAPSASFAPLIVCASSWFLAPCSCVSLPKTFLGIDHSVMSVEELHRELVRTDQNTLDTIERVLAPMFATLPKNAHGKLGHATVCYALHKYFVQQYGWFINGVGPDGSGWNTSSTMSVMEEGAPVHVQRLLERHLGSRGLNRRELAALASVLHDVVSQQYLGRSEYAYRLAGAPIEGRASQQQFMKAITMWMTMLIIGPDLPLVTSKQIVIASGKMAQYFPNWHDLLFWVEDVRQSEAHAQRYRRNPFVGGELPLEAMNLIVAKVPKQFGRWHDSLCMGMKKTLVSLGNNGRVGLPLFYGGENPGQDWQFMESVDYLRQLGALDESDPKRLRVIVPNYLIGPNNCLEASSMHTYCCKDECGDLMSEVELGIAAPNGAPGAIATIVSSISSDTVDAPRNLTVELTSKLEDLAKRHGGQVPLHGRLFAQWMHHAFPNECPHPHVSGSTAPKTTSEFQRSGGNATVGDEERAQHVMAQASFQKLAAGVVEDLSWSDEEELLSYYDSQSQEPWTPRSLFYLVILFSFLLLVVLALKKKNAWSGRVVPGVYKRASQAQEKFVV